MLLDGAKDEHFSCFRSSCKLGLSQEGLSWASEAKIEGKSRRIEKTRNHFFLNHKQLPMGEFQKEMKATEIETIFFLSLNVWNSPCAALLYLPAIA